MSSSVLGHVSVESTRQPLSLKSRAIHVPCTTEAAIRTLLNTLVRCYSSSFSKGYGLERQDQETLIVTAKESRTAGDDFLCFSRAHGFLSNYGTRIRCKTVKMQIYYFKFLTGSFLPKIRRNLFRMKPKQPKRPPIKKRDR